MIPFEIRKMTDEDNNVSYHVIIPVEYAVKDGAINKIKEVEKLTEKLFRDLNRVLNKMNDSRNNIKLNWDLGDNIYKYILSTKKFGFVCSSIPKLLEENMPKYKFEHWRILLKFRKEYPDRKLLDKKVPFWVYHELLTANKKDRKQLQKMIDKGEIKTIADMRETRTKLKEDNNTL
jgi:hypothetical protein